MIRPYFEENGIAIYHGDCRDVLPNVRADAIVTDPPFGVRRDDWDSFESEAHLMAFTGEWMSASLRCAPTLGMFWPDRYLPALMLEAWKRSIPYRRSLIWRKPSGSQMAGAALDGYWFDFETIYVFGSRPETQAGTARFAVVDARTVTGQEHGCQKPEAAYSLVLAGYVRPQGVICDPFMGTGTALVAAKRLGLSAVGIERDERSCEAAVRRLAQGSLPLEIAG